MMILKPLVREQTPIYGDGANIRAWLYVEGTKTKFVDCCWPPPRVPWPEPLYGLIFFKGDILVACQ